MYIYVYIADKVAALSLIAKELEQRPKCLPGGNRLNEL